MSTGGLKQKQVQVCLYRRTCRENPAVSLHPYVTLANNRVSKSGCSRDPAEGDENKYQVNVFDSQH